MAAKCQYEIPPRFHFISLIIDARAARVIIIVHILARSLAAKAPADKRA